MSIGASGPKATEWLVQYAQLDLDHNQATRPAFELASGVWKKRARVQAHVVGSLLILVPLLVSSGLGFVRATLLVIEGLPALTKELADLTEGDTRVLLPDILALLVGEEHVCREASLRSVGV